MRISSSVGNVIVAVPLLAAIAGLLLFELVENLVQLCEPLGPRPLVAAHPVVDGLERRAVDPVEPPATLVARLDRPHGAQDAQVLRDLGLRETERAGELANRSLTAGEQVEDLPPARLGHGVEGVGGGRGAGHGPESYSHMGMSQVCRRAPVAGGRR